eukprot:TRINITY_DN461_c0_g1_i3.p1 TRINITY_DN461_c0_g1~~TRINITY_DN461_c0_g1_i3.p1  ORF type:complete len:165 (+),score=42.66 TRINITY_DN461_c0_g1_i3:60-554(+)
MAMTKSSKFLSYVNYRMKATMVDGRVLIGKFMAFDRHMNIVMADTDEYRKLKPKNGKEREEKRTVGFVIVRGDTIVSLSVFGPPPNDSAKARVNPAAVAVLPGQGRPAGRGLPPAATAAQAPQGLTGAAPGVGAPAAAAMMPQGRGMPMGMPQMPQMPQMPPRM